MAANIQAPADVTTDVFRQWRNARRGTRVAEDLSNPYWSWLIRSGENSWSVNEHFGGPSSINAGPAWSADRFGQSTTTLPDGRVLLIAGEHEDSYDPDFYIYNDVTVRHPDGRIEILGFPENVFPPTDFHTASLVDGKIILIGCLGYPEQRKEGETQILVIDPATWEIRRQPSTGEGPGWIFKHQATLEKNSILLQRGDVWAGEEKSIIENFDDWRLHLADWRWERLTRRPVTVIEFARKDGEMNQLFEMQSWLFQQEHGPFPMLDIPELEDSDMLAELQNDMKGVAPKDREAYHRLYQPDGVDHIALPRPEDSLEHHIQVQGVLVRYVESVGDLTLIVEGELPRGIIQKLRDDLKSKIERVEGVPYVARQVKP